MVSSGATAAIAVCGSLVGLCLLSWIWTRLTKPGFHVANKHVFITGGSSGLGLAIAKQYARAGAKVTIVARDGDKLEAARREIESAANASHAVFAYACDVTDYGAVKEAVANANAFHKRITDHVICNAGTSRPGLFLEQEIEVFQNMMQLNYFGALHTIKAALPAMTTNPLQESDGFKRRVVLVSSAAALTTFIGYSQYSASKYAVRGLGDALRNELKLYDIETSIFYPGNIDTPGFAEEEKEKPDETKELDGVTTPASPDDVAASLVAGLALNKYAITNEMLLEVLRGLANGVAPRTNAPLEAIVLPIYVLVQTIFLWYFDSVVKKSAKNRK